jgi:hypothetical protein
VRVAEQRLDQLRVALIDLFERQAPRELHEVDEAEVAGPEHDHIGTGDLGCAVGGAATGGLRHGVPHRDIVLVTIGRARDAAGGQRSRDELLEVVSVSLLERRPLGLSVVGQDDELVRPGRVPAGSIDAAELLVELAQCLERVRTLEAGMVGTSS